MIFERDAVFGAADAFLFLGISFFLINAYTWPNKYKINTYGDQINLKWHIKDHSNILL